MKIDAALAAARLAAANDIALICHRDPDGDTYGSAMALFDALTGLGKRVRVECVSPFPANMPYLRREMPTFSPTFTVTIDTAAVTMLGDGEIRKRPIDLCIDHHPGNPLYAKETLLVNYAATGEAILEVIRALGVTVTPFCATALYTALISDTGSFRFSNTSAQTLRYAADLLELGADRDTVRVCLFESRSRGEVRLESAALSSMHYWADGRIASVTIPLSLLEETGVDEAELEGIASKPLQISGVDIGLTLKERNDGSVRISVRTSAAANAAAICETFLGGGHLRAAGCRMWCSMEEAERRLVEVSMATLPVAR
ncbi:MAG: bifunctional oligoribonuclease/PAP phosphatase NrnA [Oscillospiraceae bacterium]